MAKARNSVFQPEREPFRYTDTLRLDNDKIRGPFSFLNPTSAHFNHVPLAKNEPSSASPSEQEDGRESSSSKEKKEKDDVPASNAEYKWTSRNNRKGRHALVIQPSSGEDAKYMAPPVTSGFKAVMKGIWRMLVWYPFWDVSFDVAYVFTIGSVVWVINAFFALLQYTNPALTFPGETVYAGGITAFIGATIFELGSVLLMLEAVNENRTGCFGWAVESLYDEHFGHEVTRISASKDDCTHHHRNKKNFVGSPLQDNTSRATEKAGSDDTIDPTPPGAKNWVWWPSWYELRSHYLHDLGFLACSSQMFGATVFWISGFTALPGIYTVLEKSTANLNGAYWVPQVIGGMGFVVSGTLFMIETQKHWWQPAPTVLGWHIGFWNLIGGVGFTLCPIFGLLGTQYWMELQASTSTFWGSWAFLLGSTIQWYESLDKNPVETAAKDS